MDQTQITLNLIAFETFAIDGGITSIDSPETGNLSDNENITITLRNFGENDISNFDISFQINGGNIITENYSGTYHHHKVYNILHMQVLILVVKVIMKLKFQLQ